MRPTSLIFASLLIACVIAGLLIAVNQVTLVYGVGFFDQSLILQTDRPIEKVRYVAWEADDATRARAETTADPNLFFWKDAKKVQNNEYMAAIMFTTNSTCFSESVHFYRDLVVLVDFADGGRACRVVRLPERRGNGTLVVSFTKRGDNP